MEGSPLSRSRTDRPEWQSSVCCMASSSLEHLTGTSTEAHRSNTVARNAACEAQLATLSRVHDQLPSRSGSLAVVCSHMDGSDTAASLSTAYPDLAAWQMTGEGLGSQQQSWRARG